MSRLLLDTHAALFWWSASDRLGREARERISTAETTVLVSAASAWEIATKHRLGKLGDIGDPSANFVRLVERSGFRQLPITIEHGLRAGTLPGSHRDPFDRLIAAQGIMEDAIVVTRDPEIAALGCPTLW